MLRKVLVCWVVTDLKGRSVIKASLVVAIMNMCGEISCVLWGMPVLRSCLREF